MSDKLSHIDADGKANMVDISAKADTTRMAIARGEVQFSKEAFKIIMREGVKKGDIPSIAELAGIMGAKQTANLIPLCHPLPISGLKLNVEADEENCSFVVTARVKTTGKTGVEMEALTAVSVACLTIYDMAKAVDKSIEIKDIHLIEKTGGKSGDFKR